MSTRIYYVLEQKPADSKERLVEASSAGQALRAVTSDMFQVRLASALDVANLLHKGVKLKRAPLPEQPELTDASSPA